MPKEFFVYIMTNHNNTVLYTGVTNNLLRRVQEHKSGMTDGFTSRYRITKLVYYETIENAESAILREKQIKAGNRAKKIRLIESLNPKWQDLSISI
jgi:putative endonuclease